MRKLLILLLLIPLREIAQEKDSRVIMITEISVMPGHDAQFIDGMEKWKACYLENKGKEHWNVWKRMQGEGNVYSLTGIMENWAEMDKDDPAGKSCRKIVVDLIMPHVAKISKSFSRAMPEYNPSKQHAAKLVWVNFFNVNNSTNFESVIEKVSSAYRKAHGEPLAYWYSYMGGGPDDPDYRVSTLFESYADLDKERESPWEIYEKDAGKDKMIEARNMFRESLVDSWAYLYALQENLSN